MTYVRVAPSLDGYAFIDVDVGVKFQGRGVRTLLDAEVEGRDLQISSQTGAGKTVALGFVLAPKLAAERGAVRAAAAAALEQCAQQVARGGRRKAAGQRAYGWQRALRVLVGGRKGPGEEGDRKC